MPNIKSAKKRVLISNKNKVMNNDLKSSMNTLIKKCEKCIHDKDIDASVKSLTAATKKIDKVYSKNIIKKNKADRLKSRLTKKVNELK